VHWIEDERYSCIDDDPGEHGKAGLGGIVPNSLRHHFTLPRMLEDHPFLDPEAFGLDPDRAQIHRDLAVMQILVGAGFGVAFNAPTPLHQELLANTLEGAHGLELHGPDGIVRRSEAAPDLLTVLGEVLRQRLARERQDIHARDIAERDRRRAARAAGEPGRSLQDIFNEVTGREG
jgi:hypothetical protein